MPDNSSDKAALSSQDARERTDALLYGSLEKAYSTKVAELLQAISRYEASLQERTEAEFPVDWAQMQHNLGKAYRLLPNRDPEENLKLALSCFTAALHVRTEAEFPEEWATTQRELGITYSSLLTGDRGQNLKVALSHFEAALRVYTQEKFPSEWAITQNNLGLNYVYLPTGDREENLKIALTHFEAVLRVITEAEHPGEWAMTRTNLGLAYQALPTGNREGNLNQAIACFESTLRVFTQEKHPAEWAGAQNNLGATYSVIPNRDQGNNLKLAISCYKAALRVRTETEYPDGWANTQINLGAAYLSLLTGNREENLKQTIACCEAALRVYTQEEHPADWATTQNNLGAAFYSLPTGDRGANLQAALSCYEAVLRVKTETEYPVDWALAQNNRGAVYQHLPTGDQEENRKQAIACYESAVRIYTQEKFPLEWARAQCNLVGLYQQFPGDQDANLQRAIACSEAALLVYTQEKFPVEWANAQINLGGVYKALSTGDRAENLRRAISCYEAALRVSTEAESPMAWAIAQHNLGDAYRLLAEEEEPGENLQVALSCFEAALRVYTREAFPHDRLDTLNCLTILYFQLSDWQKILATCEDGIRTLESLRTVALTPTERTRLLTTGIHFFDRAVICCHQLQQYEQALVYAERGKTRNLVDLFARQAAPPQQVSPERWNHYQQCLTESHNLEQQLANRGRAGGEETVPYLLLQERVISLRSELKQIEAEFHTLDPDYLPAIPPLTFPEIQAIVTESEAILVEFRVTAGGTFVFLLGPHEQTLEEAQALYLPDFTDTSLQEIMMRSEDGKPVGGWQFRYNASSDPPQPEGLQEWQECIEDVMYDLYWDLMRPVQQCLQERYPQAKRLILVPNQQLNLLPLHAAYHYKDGEPHYLLDEYEIQYAPSCTVLRICRQRARRKGRPTSLFAVQNPANALEDLPYAAWEVGEAGRHFTDAHILSQADASLQLVRQSMGEAEEVFFSCHGVFNPDSPVDSYFALSGQERLLLGEILQRDLSRTSLAILSACETTVSDHKDTVDEVQGLHTAFLLARVPTVIGGLWSVDELATAFLMIRLHENLYKGSLRTPQALQEAQQWLRDLSRTKAEALLESASSLGSAQRAKAKFTLRDLASTPEQKPFAHPYWWAAFQCLGAS